MLANSIAQELSVMTRLRFGSFIAPVLPLGENPTLQIRREIELIEHLDRLGFDEAWVGEHHSGGAEIIASPEILVAAAAERTTRIRLGTGVITIPYHHPFLVADRAVQLDHQLMGRFMLGVGAGALAYDAHMLGIDHNAIRSRLDQSLGVIIRLMKGEVVSDTTDWYQLRDARLQMRPFCEPHMELAIPAVNTAAGPRIAGKHGASLLSIAATIGKGFDALPTTWATYCEAAQEAGRVADRRSWRMVGPVHIAESREAARRNVRFGLQFWLNYFTKVGTLPLGFSGDGDIESEIDALLNAGVAVIGTPDDLIAQIERLEQKGGEFGCFLDMAHYWADFAATKRSYELIARYVMPYFQRQLDARHAALNWAKSMHPKLSEKRREAAALESAKT
jgi:limonene 1,2-monooxygenase